MMTTTNTTFDDDDDNDLLRTLNSVTTTMSVETFAQIVVCVLLVRFLCAPDVYMGRDVRGCK